MRKSPACPWMERQAEKADCLRAKPEATCVSEGPLVSQRFLAGIAKSLRKRNRPARAATTLGIVLAWLGLQLPF